jgi:uncharacterized protein
MRVDPGWALVLAAGAVGLMAQTEVKEIPVVFPSGRRIQAELALTPEKQARGLMFRDRLDPDRGMLFVFPDASFHDFWMKNCRFPIDMIWLSTDKKIVHIEPAVPPCKEDPCPTYGSLRRAQYVLEVVANFSRQEKLALGDPIEFEVPSP